MTPRNRTSRAASLSEALAAGDLERCLEALATLPRIPHGQLLALVELAEARARPDIVVHLARQTCLPGQERADSSGPGSARHPPPRVFRLGILAALNVREAGLAARLLEQARSVHTDRDALWHAIAQRHAKALVVESAAARLAAEAEAAITQEDWPTACALVRRYGDHPERDRARFAQLAAQTHDPVGVLRAESEVLARRGETDPSALHPATCLLGVQARQDLGRISQASDLARRLWERHPSNPRFAEKHCQFLLRQSNHAEALAVARECHAAGARWAIGTVIQALLALGEPGECAAFLAEATTSWKWPERRPLALAWAKYWAGQEAPDKALSAVLAEAGTFPEGAAQQTLAQFAASARDTDLLHAQLACLAEWWEKPGGATLLRRHGPAILRAHFSHLLTWADVAPHAERLATLVLAPQRALTLAALYKEAGDFTTALEVLERSLACFQTWPGLYRAAFNALGRARGGGAGASAGIRARLRERFPPDVAMEILVTADPGGWDLADLPDMLGHALDMEDPAGQAKFFTSLSLIRPTPEQLRAVRDHPTLTARPALLARIELILTQAMDRQMLGEAVHAPVPYASFVAQRDAAHARHGAAMDRILRVEAGPGSGLSQVEQEWLAECAGHLRTIEARAPLALLQTGESYADAVALARLLIRRLRDKVPTSVLRLGDGEGHFLPPTPSVEAELEPDRAFIQRIWWGNRALDPVEAESLRTALAGSLDSADVLGVMPGWRLLRGVGLKQALAPQERGILNGLAHVAGMPRLPPVTTSAHLHHDLQKWNLWREVLGSVRSACWISCHDIAPYLAERFGVATREGILIPAEHRWAGLFGKEAAEAAARETLLDRHAALCAALAPRPGELWLVAAGSLGKIHCHLIRERGGVAIDIGSLADYWLGFSTRDYREGLAVDTAVSNVLVPGHPLAGAGQPADLLGLPSIVRSTRDGRRNRAVPEDAEAFAAAEAPRMLLRIIGHPRCASGYMATLFAAHGLEIGHEKLLRHGISSWMHVVRDLCLPYGDNASLAQFTRTVVHVRDPAEALPSIMLENGMTPSFDFRRQHILRATGVDIAAYATALDRATASLVHWLDMAMAQRPDAVFQAEAAEAPVADWLQRDPVMRQMLKAAGPDPDGHTKGLPGYNQSAGRFDRPKPVLGPADFDRMDVALRDRLEAHCERFRYVPPWLRP